MVKVYGLIEDTVALNLALKYKSHVGYFCCWFFTIEGVDVNRKRQYCYDKNIVLRSEYDFQFDSRKAEYLQRNINGRHGISPFDKILDIQLPTAIIFDYLHVTLLRHAKTICLYLYKVYMGVNDRIHFDKKVSAQRFPHFFNLKIRPFSETHLK
jgi:hypothetical protein